MTLQKHSSEKKRSISQKRIASLQKKLPGWEVDGCIVESPKDLYYLTGIELSLGRLLVSASNCVLLVDGRYLSACKEENIIPVDDLTSERALAFFSANGIQKIAFDASYTTVVDYERLQKTFPISFKAQNALLQDLRICKEEEELLLMKESADLNWRGFKHICSLLKEGITEKEIAWEYECYVRKQGAEGLAFSPIIAFGSNGAMPHYHSGDTKLKKGDAVLIDIGATYQKYQSDMTRVVFFGEVSSEVKKMYQIIQEAQQAAMKLCKPGVPIGILDQAARSVMKRENVESLFVHSLGHGIGLETHEFPRIRETGVDKDFLLQEGMVITIEPGLYLPGSFGVRYEDTIVITKTGFRNFYEGVEK